MAAKKTSKKARQGAKKPPKKGKADTKAVVGRRSNGAVVALASDERPARGQRAGRRTSRRAHVEEPLDLATIAGKSLVIVESPAKARTIGKYLGPAYRVRATVGHVRDLPEKGLGIDVEDGFKPTYVTVPGKEKTLADLKSAAKVADQVYLATDPDREGEAIAWHVAETIKHKGAAPVRRVMFHEITRDAVQNAIRNATSIDERKVEAQQARRVLDRLVGYKASPLLWKTVKKGLSAGRVQTVALRLIVEREREIRAFKPVEYWSIEALLEERWSTLHRQAAPARWQEAGNRQREGRTRDSH